MNTLIISYVVLYYVASITLGFSTSYLLSKSSYHFKYPLFFSTVQNFVHFVIARIVLRMSRESNNCRGSRESNNCRESNCNDNHCNNCNCKDSNGNGNDNHCDSCNCGDERLNEENIPNENNPVNLCSYTNKTKTLKIKHKDKNTKDHNKRKNGTVKTVQNEQTNVLVLKSVLFVSNGVLKECREGREENLIVFYEDGGIDKDKDDEIDRVDERERDIGKDRNIGKDVNIHSNDNPILVNTPININPINSNDTLVANNAPASATAPSCTALQILTDKPSQPFKASLAGSRAVVLNSIKMLPCTLTGALDISLSTYSLTNVSFALYTMVKSSSPIFILLSSFVLNNEPVSFRTFFIIFLIGLGTFLITFSHDTLNLPQVLPILFASLVSGIRWSLIQRYLTKTSIFTFIATINLNISIILLIMAIYFEGLPVLNMHSFVLIVFLSVISFFLVWCEYTILKCFSCVFLCVLGIVKEMSVVVLSVYMGKVRLEGVNWIGLVLSVCGLMMYGMKK